jgi:hypothetical protein
MNLCGHTGPYSGFDWWGWRGYPLRHKTHHASVLSRRGGHLGQWPVHPTRPGSHEP